MLSSLFHFFLVFENPAPCFWLLNSTTDFTDLCIKTWSIWISLNTVKAEIVCLLHPWRLRRPSVSFPLETTTQGPEDDLEHANWPGTTSEGPRLPPDFHSPAGIVAGLCFAVADSPSVSSKAPAHFNSDWKVPVYACLPLILQSKNVFSPFVAKYFSSWIDGFHLPGEFTQAAPLFSFCS